MTDDIKGMNITADKSFGDVDDDNIGIIIATIDIIVDWYQRCLSWLHWLL